jgi:hypothetical protein
MGHLATLDPLGYNPNQVDLFYLILATMVSRLSATPGTTLPPIVRRRLFGSPFNYRREGAELDLRHAAHVHCAHGRVPER